jgi:hypothetical protein
MKIIEEPAPPESVVQTLLYVFLLTSRHCAPGNPCSSTSHQGLSVDLLPGPGQEISQPEPPRWEASVFMGFVINTVVLFQWGNMIHAYSLATV